jgi:thioredoxin 1
MRLSPLFCTVSAIVLLSCLLQAQQETSPSPVGSLDSAGFARVRLNGKHSLIEFGGRNCIPCRQMQPVLAELNTTYGRTLNIYNVYMENGRNLFREYRIVLIPTQVIFDSSGREIGRHVGLWEKDEVVAELKRLRISP